LSFQHIRVLWALQGHARGLPSRIPFVSRDADGRIKTVAATTHLGEAPIERAPPVGRMGFGGRKNMRCTQYVTLVLATVFWAATIALLGGCATAPEGAQVIKSTNDLRSVQSYYGERLEKLRPGMALDEFKQIFPEAYPSRQNADFAEYELSKETKYVSHGDIVRQNVIWGFGRPRARTAKQSLWFYFHKGQFLSWDDSRGWPAVPENPPN
jgi:hypothetical protein